MDFQDHWDTRIDAHESIFNTNPGLANFAYCEAMAAWEKGQATLRAENERLKGDVERLRGLVRNLVDEDPSEQIADNGATVLDLWRYHARAALSRS